MIETFGDVGQRPDERERVEDRRDRDDERHQHCRQRPEDEEQDDQRAEPADQPLQQDARAAARAELGRLLDRLVPGHVDGDPGGKPVCGFGAHLRCTALHVESIRPGRVDLQEGRVPVARDVHRVAGREVRARQRAGVRLHDPRHRRPHRRALGDDRRPASGRRRRSAAAGPLRAPSVSAGSPRRPTSRERQCSDTSASRASRRQRRRPASARSRRRSPASGERASEMSEMTESSAIRSIALRPVWPVDRCRALAGHGGPPRCGGFDAPGESRGGGRAGRWRAGVCGCG